MSARVVRRIAAVGDGVLQSVVASSAGVVRRIAASSRRSWRSAPALAAVAALLAAAACTSPEAARARGGGPGADVGNRREIVEIHAGAEPYHGTPCVVALEGECPGPGSVFGTSKTLD